MKSRKWRVVSWDKDTAAGRVFNACSILWSPAVNLGGICSFAEARLGEILPDKHQRQALLPSPMFPSSLQLAFQPWKKEKAQETGLMLWMAAKVGSKRNS